MASLADLYVRIRANAREATDVIRDVRRSLTQVDQMKVKPDITIPEVANDIKALETRLATLGRQRTKLNVDSETAQADVRTLTAQISRLEASRHSVPVELRDRADAQLTELRRQLETASRKTTRIPLNLERIDASVAAVRQQLGTLAKPVGVPVTVGGSGLRSRIDSAKRQIQAGLQDGMDESGKRAGDQFGSGFGGAVKTAVAAYGIYEIGRNVVRGFGASIALAGKFDSTMRTVATTLGVTGEGMTGLTGLAQKMGAETSFSAQGASDAMLELAKGGMNAAQIEGGALAATLTLATAGGLELGDAASYMVNGMNAFQLEAKDSGSIAAALAGAANASTASVESLGLGLSQTSAQAHTAGLSLQDTVAALAALDNAGIKGSDSGTSLKVMLQRLVPDTNKAYEAFMDLGLITVDAQKAMDLLRENGVTPLSNRSMDLIPQLREMAAKMVNAEVGTGKANKAFQAITAEAGVLENQFFDANGNIKSMADISGTLARALQGQTKEQKIATLNTLFGSDASRAAGIIAQTGAKQIGEYAKAANDQSQAERLAKSATAGYAGALERAGGAIETLGIQIGTALLPFLTKMLNVVADKMIPALSSFVSFLSDNTGVLGGFAAVVGFITTAVVAQNIATSAAAAGGMLRYLASTRLVTAATRTATAVQWLMVASLRAVRIAIALATGPIGLIITGLIALASGVIYLYRHNETFRNGVNALAAALKGALLASIHALGVAWDWLKGATVTAWGAIKSAVSTAWQGIVGFFTGSTSAVTASVGGAWQTVRTATVTAWTAIKSAVSTAWTAIGAFFSTAVQTIVTPIVNAWGAVKTATAAAFTAVATIVGAALKILGRVIMTGIAIALVPLYLAWKAAELATRLVWKGIEVIIRAVWDVIGPYVLAAVTKIRTWVTTGWNAISSVTIAVWNAIKKFLSTIWAGITAVFSAAQAVIRAALATWWNNLKTNTVNTFNAIKAFISTTWENIRKAWATVTEKIRAAFATWWTNLKAKAVEMFNNIKTFLSNTWKSIKDSVFADYMRRILAAFTTWWSNLKTKASDQFRAIKDNISSRWDTIKTTFRNAIADVKGKWDGFWRDIREAGRIAMDKIKNAFNALLGPGGSVRTIFSKGKAAIGQIWDGIKGKATGPIKFVVDTVLRRGLVGAFDKIAGVLPGVDPIGKKISWPTFRAGGPVQGPGTGTSDSIVARLSNGEHVLTAEEVKKLGGHDAVDAFRQDVRRGTFDSPPRRSDIVGGAFRDGGRVIADRIAAALPRLFLGGRAPVPGTGHRHSGYGWARWAGDFPSGYGGQPPVHAWKGGVVASVRRLSTSYGHHIRVNHGGEQTLYAHLNRIAVGAGQRVGAGQVIGNAGWTGNVQPRGPGGAHLHFELSGGSAAPGGGAADRGGILGAIVDYAAKMKDAIAGPLNRLREIGSGPWAQMAGAVPRRLATAMVDNAKGWASEALGNLGSKFTGAIQGLLSRVGGGAGGIRRVANAFNPTYIASHRDPQGGAAFDIGSSGQKNTDIGNALRAAHSRLGLRYVIRQMQIASPRQGWAWRPYSPITGSGDFRHVDHVHVSYRDGGRVELADGGLVRGGRGGVTAHIGEGRVDELVTPLPRGWNPGRQSDQLERIAALLETGRAGNVTFDFDVYNPVAEPVSLSTNRALQKTANLGLLG